MNTPVSRRTLYVILLGVAGMALFYRYMLLDLKITGPKTEYWAVTDTNKHIDGKTKLVINILRVDYLPLSKNINDDLKKEQANDKTAPGKLPITGIIGFDSLVFAYNSAFLVWIAFGAIMMGFAMAFIPVLVRTILQIKEAFHLKKREVYIAIGTTLLLGLVMSTSDISSYMMGSIPLSDKLQILVKHPGLLKVFILINMGTGLIAFAGQLFINTAIDTLPREIISLDASGQRSLGISFLLLRNKLRFFLLIDSVLIVFSVLTTDAFRGAVLSAVKINMEIIPQNYTYLYGLMFTFFLSIVYLPVYSRLKEKGQQLIDTIPQDRLDSDMKGIATTLSIQQSAVDSLQVALSILAPVITALVPGLLKV